MTQTEFNFPARRKPSLTDRLEQHFLSRPGQWIPVPAMAALVGVSGVRQRRLEVEQRGLVLERRAWTDSSGHKHLDWRWTGQRKGVAA
jgi:hypothetical protein